MCLESLPFALSTRWITVSVNMKKRNVVVVGASLRGSEGPVCQPDPLHREVSCLLGAQLWDVTRRLHEPIQPSNYYPLLVFQGDCGDVDKKGT